MRYSVFLLFSMAVTYSTISTATNLSISNIEFQLSPDTTVAPKVKMNVHWDNAWHNGKNKDGAWIFIKFDQPNGWGRHALVATGGHRVLASHKSIDAEIVSARNRAGVFISPSSLCRGDVSWTIEIELDRSSVSDIDFWKSQCQVYGIEMVYIPQGAFYLGDPSEEAVSRQSFYRCKNGEKGEPYPIRSEDAIEIGTSNGQLYYDVATPQYQGDQRGPLPTSFPKGYQSFTCMKYELTQGQYADFLNSISDDQTHHRANFGGRNYYKNRGSIYFDRKTDSYVADYPDRPCNYITWDDAMAFADWAGLRPMTELEYTKACRGPQQPIAGQYPWGTDSKDKLQRGVSRRDNLIMFNHMTEDQLSDNNRDVFGASFYWVMDLAGSLWEKVITIGHEKGRAFTGEHGDGRLNGLGFANVADWPKGFDEGGYGYRGGGYYYHGRNYHGFNPHSPIAYRPFAAWAAGNRSIAYSTRFVRSDFEQTGLENE